MIQGAESAGQVNRFATRQKQRTLAVLQRTGNDRPRADSRADTSFVKDVFAIFAALAELLVDVEDNADCLLGMLRVRSWKSKDRDNAFSVGGVQVAPCSMRCAVVSRINFAVVSANAAGSRSFANASLLAISHTTTLTSYGFGRGSNGAVPSLIRRNSFLERRSAKNVLTRCEWSLRKKPDQPSASTNANTSARTEGTGWKNTR